MRYSDMARGGKRNGAGAPKGNQNAFKHGGRAKVLYGIALNRQLTSFEYKALCFEQLDAIKKIDEAEGGWVSPSYLHHKKRYRGALLFSERRVRSKCRYTKEHKEFMRYAKERMKFLPTA